MIISFLAILICYNTLAQDNVYIGSAVFLPSTNEIYIDALVKNNAEFEFYDIANKADSMVYEGDEITRKRIPTNIAKQYFNIVPDLVIYNREGKYKTDASFERLEYYKGLIEDKFIAVYKIKSAKSIEPKDSRNLYAIQKHKSISGINKLNFIQDDIEQLPEVCGFLDIPISDIVFSSSIEILNTGDKYLFISTADYTNNLFVSYIIIESNQKFTIAKKEQLEFIFHQVTPTVLQNNCRPVFLIKYTKPDTDWIWEGIEVYENGRYTSLNNKLLKLKEKDCP